MSDTDFLDADQEKNPLKPGENLDPLTRNDVLRISSQLIRTLHKCVSVARFKQQSDDSKLSFVRTLIAAIKAYEGILAKDEIQTLQHQMDAVGRVKDIEILNLRREIEILQQARSEVKS